MRIPPARINHSLQRTDPAVPFTLQLNHVSFVPLSLGRAVSSHPNGLPGPRNLPEHSPLLIHFSQVDQQIPVQFVHQSSCVMNVIRMDHVPNGSRDGQKTWDEDPRSLGEVSLKHAGRGR